MSKHKSLNHPTSIIISGVESDTYFDIVVRKNNIRFVLMSYHYLQKKPKDFLAKRLEEFPDLKVFIDSGAHTFLTNDEWFDKPASHWEPYLKDYRDFVISNSDYIFACANLDLEDIVGNDQVDAWNDEYFQPIEDSGVEVCYIWHHPRGETGWEEMCQKHSYIGMSMQADSSVTVQKLMRRMKVASKYNTRVHGMALTKTEILVRVPFFSADSTTWLVGQQYGELNWFNGRKMQRLSKDQWRRQYKTKLLKPPFNADWELVTTGMGGQGDTYELLRLNVVAYELAEKHIRERLRTKMYWMEGDYTEEIEVLDLEDIQVPELEWFEGKMDDWKQYMMKLRIPPSGYGKDEAVNLLMFFSIFVKRDYELLEEQYEEQEIIDYAKTIQNEPVSDYDDAVNILSDYFIGNATGERNELRDDGDENLSDAPAQAKERKEYIMEDAFDLIDLSEGTITQALAIEPPKERDMPEIEAYDEELKRNNIVPVRDASGKFLKGQQRVRKQKNMYSSKYPMLNCDTCYKAGDCPAYQAGFVCAYDKMFKRFDTRNAEDVMDAMSSMVNHNLERLQRAMMFETMDGGMATPEVTGLIDQNARLLEKLQNVQAMSAKTILQQRRTVMADGTQTVDTSMAVNPQQGGILSQIFGGMGASKDEEEIPERKEATVINVDYD